VKGQHPNEYSLSARLPISTPKVIWPLHAAFFVLKMKSKIIDFSGVIAELPLTLVE
jgi:hypothetical protein